MLNAGYKVRVGEGADIYKKTLKSLQLPLLKSWVLNEVLNNYTLYAVLIRILQRNRTNIMCIWREIYFKELAHMIVKAAKSNILRGGTTG